MQTLLLDFSAEIHVLLIKFHDLKVTESSEPYTHLCIIWLLWTQECWNKIFLCICQQLWVHILQINHYIFLHFGCCKYILH